MIQLGNGRFVEIGDTVTLVTDDYRVPRGSVLEIVEDNEAYPYFTDVDKMTIEEQALFLFPHEFK